MNHNQKVKLATKMRTKEEVGQGVALFKSLNWRKRKFQIIERVRRHEVRAKYYSEVKRGDR